MAFTVFITGASSGIGAALAQEYAQKGRRGWLGRASPRSFGGGSCAHESSGEP